MSAGLGSPLLSSPLGRHEFLRLGSVLLLRPKRHLREVRLSFWILGSGPGFRGFHLDFSLFTLELSYSFIERGQFNKQLFQLFVILGRGQFTLPQL